jgi:hypothetical protein
VRVTTIYGYGVFRQLDVGGFHPGGRRSFLERRFRPISYSGDYTIKWILRVVDALGNPIRPNDITSLTRCILSGDSVAFGSRVKYTPEHFGRAINL